MMSPGFDMTDMLRMVVVSFVPIIFAITFHEAAHAYAAYRMGDRTAFAVGRLTLNPIRHIDLWGTIIMPLGLYVITSGQFVFGYAKPVPINPMNFKNPRRGMALSAAAGPATNFLLATLSHLLLAYVLFPLAPMTSDFLYEPLSLMLKSSFYINTALAAINLMPMLPLDGGRVLNGFLPRQWSLKFERIEPYGMIIVIILLVTKLAYWFIIPVMLIMQRIIQFL